MLSAVSEEPVDLLNEASDPLTDAGDQPLGLADPLVEVRAALALGSGDLMGRHVCAPAAQVRLPADGRVPLARELVERALGLQADLLELATRDGCQVQVVLERLDALAREPISDVGLDWAPPPRCRSTSRIASSFTAPALATRPELLLAVKTPRRRPHSQRPVRLASEGPAQSKPPLDLQSPGHSASARADALSNWP